MKKEPPKRLREMGYGFVYLPFAQSYDALPEVFWRGIIDIDLPDIRRLKRKGVDILLAFDLRHFTLGIAAQGSEKQLIPIPVGTGTINQIVFPVILLPRFLPL